MERPFFALDAVDGANQSHTEQGCRDRCHKDCDFASVDNGVHTLKGERINENRHGKTDTAKTSYGKQHCPTCAFGFLSETTLDENVLRRELSPLQKIKDNYPKYLLTLDTLFGEMDYEGIQKTNALNWLLA